MAPWRRASPAGIAAFVAIAFTVVAAVAVVCLRTVEVEAEYDRYHQIAEHLLQGRMAWDRFHPFGYPMLVAGVLWLVGNSLVAGGLVSAAAAGVVIWATSRIADRLRPGAGLAAALLVASNGVVWVYATMASSDMTAVAAMFAAVAVLVSAPSMPSAKRALVIGLLLGFAASVRITSLIGLVIVGLWLLDAGPDTTRGCHRRRLAVVFASATGIVIGYLPQAIPATLLVGSPLHNDNWHNVYLKVVCNFDYECLQRTYDTGTLPTAVEFVRAHAGDILRLGLTDTWLACSQVLPSMAFGSTLPVSGLWLWPLLLALVGLVLCSTAPKIGWALLAITGALVLMTCFAFRPHTRVLLGALPVVSAGIAVLCQALPRPWLRRGALVGCIALSVGFGVRSYAGFLADQPVAEVQLVQRLPAIVQRPMGLLTTLPVADRYVAARVLGYMAPGFATPQATWDAVRERMDAAGADVFLTGRVSNAQVFSHVTSAPVPPDFTLLYRDADAIALERRPAVSAWIDSFAVEPRSPRVGETVVCRLQLSAATVTAEVAGTGVAVRDANGDQSLFDLPPAAAGIFQRAFVVPSVLGDWLLTPFVLRGNGQVLHGPETPMRVRP